MSAKKCPKCEKISLMKQPMGRIMRESLGSMINIGSEYQWKCIDTKCGYSLDKERINTKMGDHFEKPWYKRIF